MDKKEREEIMDHHFSYNTHEYRMVYACCETPKLIDALIPDEDVKEILHNCGIEMDDKGNIINSAKEDKKELQEIIDKSRILRKQHWDIVKNYGWGQWGIEKRRKFLNDYEINIDENKIYQFDKSVDVLYKRSKIIKRC